MPSDPGSAKGGLPPSPNYIQENPPHWTQARLKAHNRQLPISGAWDAAPTPTTGCPGCPALGPPSLLPPAPARERPPNVAAQAELHSSEERRAREGGERLARHPTGDCALPRQRGRGRAQDKRDEERERRPGTGPGSLRAGDRFGGAGRTGAGGPAGRVTYANQERALHELTRRL